jgi:hypothetical protein
MTSAEIKSVQARIAARIVFATVRVHFNKNDFNSPGTFI